ncbi:type VI secretion system protein ImpM [Roseateles sp. YR242]|uniref:type VI secretion system-associated protein TagF n=1 Tax=Roseateles sp. YR242 TaxID=1855305 RepID=UPI0008C54918|nr:type VI secretion system-associated protein TagF [Roseateles sp. YR242]SEL36421.1 type VI secretion system protein ImpM [Roseateles sp. YR242]
MSSIGLPPSTAADPSSAELTPGWYGKLAPLGDFAQRRLPTHWVRHCDPWLSQLMRELPSVLGPNWLDLYLTAPVIRFAWAPGVVDMKWWFGVLMPSCDNVGRYFPLVIAQQRSDPPVDRAGLEHLERWYNVLSQAALHTLEDGASLESFEQRLAAAPAFPASAAAAIPLPEAAHRWQTFSPPSPSLPTGMAMLAAGELLERLAGCTVWSTRAVAPETPQYQWGPALPNSRVFANLLTQAR